MEIQCKYSWQKYPWQKYPWQEYPWQKYPWQKYPLPCAHVSCCILCAKDLNDCPICRQMIEIRHKIFFG
jgi:C3HC4-type zinc finger (RING finger) protein